MPAPSLRPHEPTRPTAVVAAAKTGTASIASQIAVAFRLAGRAPATRKVIVDPSLFYSNIPAFGGQPCFLCPEVLLWPAAKPREFTAIALGWSPFPQQFIRRQKLALLSCFLPRFFARLCLSIERLRNRRGSTRFTQLKHLYQKKTAIVFDL